MTVPGMVNNFVEELTAEEALSKVIAHVPVRELNHALDGMIQHIATRDLVQCATDDERRYCQGRIANIQDLRRILLGVLETQRTQDGFIQ